MTALTYWKTIAANAHKVEGLRVEIAGRTVSVFRSGEYVYSATISANPRIDRESGMQVVDAIEAAGLAYFHRSANPLPVNRFLWVSGDQNGDLIADEEVPEEHLALLSCIAQTMEKLGERT